MNWEEVLDEHRVISAINSKNGKVISLLFSLDYRRKRINQVDGEKLLFFFPYGSKGKRLETLEIAIEEHTLFNVYRKISPDNWVNAGKHKVVDKKEGYDSLGRKSIIYTVVQP